MSDESNKFLNDTHCLDCYVPEGLIPAVLIEIAEDIVLTPPTPPPGDGN